MPTTATGTFEITMLPQPANIEGGPSSVRLDKQFAGDLAGSSVGQMLAARTAVEGSAGYVAIERVTGNLRGRSGSFVLQHSGTMDRGAPTLSVRVVPDSGTEGLIGLTGSMTIERTGGQHLYRFEYELAEPSSTSTEGTA